MKLSKGYLLVERNNESALKVSSQTVEVEERKKNDNRCA